MIETNENAFDEFESYQDFTDLNTKELLTEVWLKPKKVFAYIFKHEPNKYVQPLLFISAFVSVFNRAIEKNSFNFNSSNNVAYILGVLVGGTLLTYLLYYISAWFLKLFGNVFLNGNANSKAYRTVIAWSGVPTISSIIATIILLTIFGTHALSTFEPSSYTEIAVFFIVGLFQLALGIWSIIIMVTGIMHIQKFNVWKAIGNVFLPFIILIMVFVIIFVLGDLAFN